MTPGDHQLLHDVAHALSAAPFAREVTVCGLTLSRTAARQIERTLLQLRSQTRKAA